MIVQSTQVDTPTLVDGVEPSPPSQVIRAMSLPSVIIKDDASGALGETLELCAPLQWPQQSRIDEEFVKLAATRMLASSHRPHDLLALFVLPAGTLTKLLRHAIQVLSKEHNLLDVLVEADACAHVIGDIHGDYHSLIQVLNRTGLPSDKNKLVFLGDYVDRSPWGVEVLCLVLLLKALRPDSVFLIRGNHETTGCTARYGFTDEVCRKYSNKMLPLFHNIFRQLPLAAVIHLAPSPATNKAEAQKPGSGQRRSKRIQKRQVRQVSASNAHRGARWSTEAQPGERRILALHGGLFRSPKGRHTGKLEVGTLVDIAETVRRDDDPLDCVAEDILWSDPQVERNGVEQNRLRGAGILYGATTADFFFRGNGLHGMLRAHEGPDMREKRENMNPMLDGFSVDIEGGSGYVATVFSAADYRKYRTSARFDGRRVSTAGAFRRPATFVMERGLTMLCFTAAQKPRGNLGAFATLHGRGKPEANAAGMPTFTSYDVPHRPCEAELFYEENDGAVTPRTSMER